MSLPRDALIDAADDGLACTAVGPWAEDKYRRLGMYAAIFSTGMKHRWDERIYVDLFAGPGHALIQDHHFPNHQRRVLSSPLIALSVPDQFDRYVFCDIDPDFLDALRQRADRMRPTAVIQYVEGDANTKVAAIEDLIPQYRKNHMVLSLSVVDPFDLGIHFSTIERLGARRAMDFIVLLATDMDGRRNWQAYLEAGNGRVAAFLGDDDWRTKWAAMPRDVSAPRFLAEQYARAMEKIGYLRTPLDRMIPIRTYANKMQLYYLAFFSKSTVGLKFWDEVRRYATEQTSLL
jgi:three-Cys-motif partner protein